MHFRTGGVVVTVVGVVAPWSRVRRGLASAWKQTTSENKVQVRRENTQGNGKATRQRKSIEPMHPHWTALEEFGRHGREPSTLIIAF